MFFTPQILVHQKTKPQNFCEKADMKLRWKQVRILHGPATVRKERFLIMWVCHARCRAFSQNH